MTLQQSGNNLTGTWSTPNYTLSLTGSINGQSVHLVSDHIGSAGDCHSDIEFSLTDSTHMKGTATESGNCGSDFLTVNDAAVKS
jgi:hypothetical protein